VLFLGGIFWRDHRAFRDVPGWSRERFSISLKRHFVFSWPIAATFISVSFGNQVCTLIYAKMSITHFAAITLIAPWIQVLGTFGMAWAQATGITIAQLLGGGADEKTLDEFLSRAWRVAFYAAGIVSLTYLIFGLSSGWIYSGLQPETTLALLTFLPTLLLIPFPKGSNAICGQTLRAAGDTVYVMNIFISGQWLFKVPLTFLFVVILGLPVGWVFTIFLLEELFKFPLFHRRLYLGKWKHPQELL
jgi:Na+-driven multidrug efflux pump